MIIYSITLALFMACMHAVGGGSARGEVGGMEISDGEQRPTHGGGEW